MHPHTLNFDRSGFLPNQRVYGVSPSDNAEDSMQFRVSVYADIASGHIQTGIFAAINIAVTASFESR